jgi:histidine decarboxylase
MKKKVFASPFPLPAVVNGAISPFDEYCMGYMNPGNSGLGYISTMKLSVDMVSMAGLDEGTEGIVSYDRCEKDDAYIGQINMLTASSFCGVNGALWGYHLATADSIANGSIQPMYYENQNGGRIPVYPVYPLLDAAQRLFGVDAQRRFPPMPGAHVICANKNFTSKGSACWVWASIAIAIADNRDTDANLFIEDAGSFPGNLSAPTVVQNLKITQTNVTKSIILCGQDQNVLYKEIFVGYKYLFVPQGYVGCALTCAPYVSLARDAIPAGYVPSDLLNMTISQWEKLVGLPPLPPARRTGEKRLIVKEQQTRTKQVSSRKRRRQKSN